ncbi:MAG TPA: PRC-barrel domain-containing protein [Alphaproteobacteria bacterium]|nr:PRC-barrel domain-containing protein [Alphaproteobacteria bacterium]
MRALPFALLALLSAGAAQAAVGGAESANEESNGRPYYRDNNPVLGIGDSIDQSTVGYPDTINEKTDLSTDEAEDAAAARTGAAGATAPATAGSAGSATGAGDMAAAPLAGLIGAPVTDGAGARLGTVEDFVVDARGARLAIVRLDATAQPVAVPAASLRRASGGGLAATTPLAGQPAWRPGAGDRSWRGEMAPG